MIAIAAAIAVFIAFYAIAIAVESLDGWIRRGQGHDTDTGKYSA